MAERSAMGQAKFGANYDAARQMVQDAATQIQQLMAAGNRDQAIALMRQTQQRLAGMAARPPAPPMTEFTPFQGNNPYGGLVTGIGQILNMVPGGGGGGGQWNFGPIAGQMAGMLPPGFGGGGLGTWTESPGYGYAPGGGGVSAAIPPQAYDPYGVPGGGIPQGIPVAQPIGGVQTQVPWYMPQVPANAPPGTYYY